MQRASSSIENLGNKPLETSYLTVLPELEAMDSEDLVPVNLEIVAAVTTAHGVFPELVALRPRIAKLPEFDLAKFDRLRAYASAAAYAQTLHMVAVQPQDDFHELVEEGTRIRELLFAEAGPLILRGLVAEEALRDVRRGKGFRILVTDLQLLVNVFQANWARIEGKLATTREDLERASVVVANLIEILGLREQGPAGIARTTLLRDKAFTLFVRTYDQARRAVKYLRWAEDDIDEIIPSLYRGRGGRRKASVEETADTTLLGLGAIVPSLDGVTSKEATSTTSPSPIVVRSGGPFMQ